MAMVSFSLNLTGFSMSAKVFVILIPYPACSLPTFDALSLAVKLDPFSDCLFTLQVFLSHTLCSSMIAVS